MKKRWISLSLIFALTATAAMPVSAARKDELQAQKAANQSKLSQVEATVASLESQKKALLGQIDSKQQQLVNVMTQIDMLDDQVAEKEADIARIQEELKQAEADRDAQYEAMKKRIQYMYENSGVSNWATQLLEAESIANVLTKAENTEKMVDYDRKELESLKEAVETVQDLEAELEGEKASLESTRQEQQGVQQSLESQVSDLQASASDYESQIASAQAQAQTYKSLIQQQNTALKEMKQQEEAVAKASVSDKKETGKTDKTAGETTPSTNPGETTQVQKPAAEQDNHTTEETGNEAPEENTEVPETNVTEPEEVPETNVTVPEEVPEAEEVPETVAPEPEETTEPEAEESSSPSYNASIGQQIVSYAEQFIGNPYVYGGNSLTNGIDCSGFTQQIYGHFGYSLPRTSDAQASSGVGISYSEHQAGDLIVYPGHVAILTGDGGIVHASNSAPYPQGGIKYTSDALYTSYIAVRRIAQ